MKKNVLIVALALLVVGGGGFIAGDKLGKKNSTPETTVESTTVENATAEAVEKVVGSAVDERVDEAPVTNAAVANKEVVVDEKVTYVTGNKAEPEVKVTVPAEKVTVKEHVVVTETVKPVEKVTAKAPVVVTEAIKPVEKVTVKAPVVVTKAETTKNSVGKISREKAKSIALNHAGVKEADVRELEIELDYEKGVHVYEVSFESGKYDYEYYIDAVTGAIKFSEKEPEAVGKVNKTETKAETTKNSAEKISREKAKSIALNHAGLKEADVRGLEIELDYDKGVHVYEVSFESGRYEYDYDIDAYSGVVKFSEKSFDD